MTGNEETQRSVTITFSRRNERERTMYISTEFEAHTTPAKVKTEVACKFIVFMGLLGGLSTAGARLLSTLQPITGMLTQHWWMLLDQ